jgi:hypothetical protein
MTAARSQAQADRDMREADYKRFLGWGWNPVDAAFAAYFGKPFRAVPEAAAAASEPELEAGS